MNPISLQPHVKAADLPLDRLVSNTTLSDEEKSGEVCRQFEAILLRQILQESQKKTFKSNTESNSAASGIYQDMVTNQMADSISRSGSFGLASSFKSQLIQQVKNNHAEENPETGSSDESSTRTL
jgi:Rod binding domain-containing protein